MKARHREEAAAFAREVEGDEAEFVSRARGALLADWRKRGKPFTSFLWSNRCSHALPLTPTAILANQSATLASTLLPAQERHVICCGHRSAERAPPRVQRGAPAIIRAAVSYSGRRSPSSPRPAMPHLASPCRAPPGLAKPGPASGVAARFCPIFPDPSIISDRDRCSWGVSALFPIRARSGAFMSLDLPLPSAFVERGVLC